jgi:hypothetical protein
VDGIKREETFLLIELELIEPYLCLNATGGSLDAFADAIESCLDRHPITTIESERAPEHVSNQ